MKKVIVLVLGTLLLSGCAVRVADLIVASIENYNLNGGKFYKGCLSYASPSPRDS